MTYIKTIKFFVTKNGQRRALYWGAARRWLPISVAEAEIKLATDPRYVLQQGEALKIG